MRRYQTFTLLLTASLIVFAHFATAEVPSVINYQGRLTDSSGTGLDTTVSVTFTIYDDPTGSNQLWTETHNEVVVRSGLFSVILGSTDSLGSAVFAGPLRYIGISVNGGPEAEPRTRLTSAPFAHKVGTIDGASGGHVLGDISIGGRATIGPGHENAGPHAFVAGTNNTASDTAATVGGGRHNYARGVFSVVAGGGGANVYDSNSASGAYSGIGGGSHNSASGEGATVAGGLSNRASGSGAFVGGGWSNVAEQGLATVVGGSANLASGSFSSILGGFGDTITASGHYSYLFGISSKLTSDSTFMVDMPHIHFGTEVTGYEFPTADGASNQVMATDGNGRLNWTTMTGGGGGSGGWSDAGSVVHLSDDSDSVGVGTATPLEKLHVDGNLRIQGRITAGVNCVNTGEMGTFVAGHECVAEGDGSVIGGGFRNISEGTSSWGSTIGGGWRNRASGSAATVAGGEENHANSALSTIGGGLGNWASHSRTTIAGGDSNLVYGRCGAIGGGRTMKCAIRVALLAEGLKTQRGVLSPRCRVGSVMRLAATTAL